MIDAIQAISVGAAPAGGGSIGVSPARPAQRTPTGSDAKPSSPQQPVSREALQTAVDTMQRQALELGADLEFRIDEELDRVIVTLLDRRDGSVLRQIPSEEVLRIAHMLAETHNPLVQAVA